MNKKDVKDVKDVLNSEERLALALAIVDVKLTQCETTVVINDNPPQFVIRKEVGSDE